MAKFNTNNIKIALLVIGALLLAIFGVSFIKGKKLFGTDQSYYSLFSSAQGLSTADKVLLNGVEIGQVQAVELSDNLQGVKISYTINDDIQLPLDSKVTINPGLGSLSSASIGVIVGKSSDMAKVGNQFDVIEQVSLTEKTNAIIGQLEPTTENLNNALKGLDSVATNLNTILSGNNAANIESALANLNTSMRRLNSTTQKADELVASQSTKIDAILGNLQSISTNLKENQKYIDNALVNFSKTSDELASLKLKNTLDSTNETIAKLNGILSKVDNGEGSLSLLLNDADLYNNLNNTARDLDRLILDIKEDPSEVVPSISIFGGKKNKK